MSGMYLNNTLKSGYPITSDNSGAEIGEMGLFFGWDSMYVLTMLFISFRKHFEKPVGLIPKHFGLFLREMHNSKLPDEQMIMINTNFHQSNFFKGRPKEFLLN